MYLCGVIMKLDDFKTLWDCTITEVRLWHLQYMLYHSKTEEELDIMRDRGLDKNVYGHGCT
jgi:hypothetical protein